MDYRFVSNVWSPSEVYRIHRIQDYVEVSMLPMMSDK